MPIPAGFGRKKRVTGQCLHLCGLLHVDGFSQCLAKVGRDVGKVGDSTLLDEGLCVNQVAGNVVDETLASGSIKNRVPEDGGLAEVVLIASIETMNLASHFVRALQGASTLRWLWTFEAVWIIVGSAALVVVRAHRSIALVVSDRDLRGNYSIIKLHAMLRTYSVGAINRQLQVVGAQTMAMSVGVREQTSLQHLVGRWFNARNLK